MLRLTAYALAACALASLSVRAQEAQGPTAVTGVYVRSDTDTTTVISPRLEVSAPITEQTRAEVVYTVDVWSSASIDIRTSASKAVTEQRDELNVALTQELPDMRIAGSYRFSTEPDYESHFVALGAERDFSDKSTVIGGSALLGFDAVGRVGDPDFDESLRTMGLRASALQVIDPNMFVQLEYELGHARGYQASPYRFIGIGTRDGTCRVRRSSENAVFCVPETNPELRVRHALAVRARRALGDHVSVGAEYRFYIDSWAVSSSTVSGDVAFLPAERTLLGLRYRFYKQSAAEHYRPRYREENDAGLYTRDKELSPLTSHKLALDAEQGFVMDERGRVLRAVLSVGPVFYDYTDYLLLDSITALDATLTLVMEL